MVSQREYPLMLFLFSGLFLAYQSISPGAVDTEIINKEAIPDLPPFPMLRSEDVADAISYCIQTPPSVQIHELIIKPLGESF